MDMADLFGGGVRPEARRGRGAGSNHDGRFERFQHVREDDGWTLEEDAPLRTEVIEDASRTVLARNTSPDVPFDRSINPYRGCEHGCIYCFARPTHAFLGLSPGLDFETRILVKSDAPARLVEELRRPRYTVRPIAMGTNTDPYQPIERDRRIMRGILEVLEACNHPVTIVTKGGLIARDIDILGAMARRRLVHVAISVTTLDPHLARAMEPRAATPALRLRTVRALVKAGIPTGVMMAPIIPALTDHEIERVLAAAAAAGAKNTSYVCLRLPREVAPLFRDWLSEVMPDRAPRILRYVREMHGGKDYDAEWGKRMTGEGVYAELIARRFHLAREREGLRAISPSLDTRSFRRPERAGDQLALDL
ncbi:MAG: PA0069 family radical SAM protein [Pseudomonadota bacterium]